MKNNLDSKLLNYNKSFSRFLNESENDFILLERVDTGIFRRIIADPTLLQKAKLTFKTFKNEESFDREWVDIIGKLMGNRSELVDRLVTVVPMMVYNFLKDNESL